MKRIIYYLLLIIALCFVSEVKAQNNYVKLNYGNEMLISDDLHSVNNALGFEVGHFFTPNSAFVIDYLHGFKKDGVSFNKVGINYLYEFSSSYYFAPFLKCGVGYKNYSICYNDDFNGAELNIGFGINAYLTDYVALSIGLDLSNTAFIYSSEWHWNWDSSLLTPKIGLSYNF
jgi:hypothetical protein